MRTAFFVLPLLAFAVYTPAVHGQEWADKMFNKREHDFQTVVRGSEAVYRFEVKNIFKETMRIAGVRSSCGCTTPTVENNTIGTHEKAYIVAKLDTLRYTGRRSATLTVTFAAPYRAEVQLRVHANIRGDLTFTPGSLSYGSVDEGSTAERRIEVLHTGNSGWRIVDITNDNDFFEVELNETMRAAGLVKYELLVRLKDHLPPGYLRDQLSVVTNDPQAENERIPLFVEAHVVPELSVTPATLVLGEIEQGETVTQKIVVRGKKPFRIAEVNCGSDCLTFRSDDQEKPLHLVDITFQANGPAGPMRKSVVIRTASGRTAQFEVAAEVIPAPAAPEQQAIAPGPAAAEDDEASQVAGTASN